MPAVIVVFTGPAGSGKSSLVKSYAEWARKNLFLKVATVNLDPGPEELLYDPAFDIRKLFTIRDVMERYGLGPNGAFIKASELIAEYTDYILSQPPFSQVENWDLILVDTPGQMEAFIFRPSSRVFLGRVSRIANTVLVYIIDASAIDKVSDTVFLWFLYVLLQVKTGLTVIPVVNKRDIARNLELARMLVEDPAKLVEKATDEGLVSEVLQELIDVASKTRGPFRAVLVSARNLEDMQYLHTLVHEAFCACGDLT